MYFFKINLHKGGVNTPPLAFLRDIFWLKCRTSPIFSLTQRTMLGDPSRYLEHVRKAHRKFFTVLWNKSFASKYLVLLEYSEHIWASFFQNPNFFQISLSIIWVVYRKITIFSLTQRTRLDGSFRYIGHVRKVHKNFSTALWNKSFSSKN